MGFDVQYDDSNFNKLYAEMEEAQRLRALKGAFRRTATYVRRVAVKNLRTISAGKKSSPLRCAQRLSKSIRAEVFTKKAGFRVTISPPKGKKGKPPKLRKGVKEMDAHVLRWAEYGTGGRYRKGKTRQSFLSNGNERRRYTGFMSRYGFMTKTDTEVKDNVTNMVHDSLRLTVKKIAEKYGCTTKT